MSLAKRMQLTNNRLLASFDERKGDDRLAILKQGDKTWNATTGRYDFASDTKYFLTGVQIVAAAVGVGA